MEKLYFNYQNSKYGMVIEKTENFMVYVLKYSFLIKNNNHGKSNNIKKAI